MLIQGLEALDHTISEACESVPLWSTENTNKLSCQFEWCSLEMNSFAGCIGQHKAKIYMNQVTFPVYDDIRIVSVFYLQDVADKLVSSQ